MKIPLKLVLGTSILLATLVSAPLVYSEVQQNMTGMSGQNMNQMMDMVQGRMQGMSKIMDEAKNTQDMNKRHELMQKHMAKMQEMMGNMQGMMGDKMSGNMDMAKRQEMMGNRMDMMQGMMEQMMRQQAMTMDMTK